MGRPRQFDAQEAVDKATSLFWRKGYAATTPEDLTGALGISKGSLYNAFDSKQALFQRALERYGDLRLAALAEILKQPGTAKARLRTALLKLAHGRGEPPIRGCMAVNTAVELGNVDLHAKKATKDIFDRMENLFRDFILEAQRKREVSGAKDPATVASQLLSTVLALQVLGRAGDAPARSKRIIEAVLETL